MNLAVIGSIFTIILLFINCVTAEIDLRNLKCLVCRAVVEEMDKVIHKIDPKRKISIGNYALDSKGNQKQKTVPFARSEMHLTDVMDSVCNKMEDYVRATYKSNGALTLLRMIDDNGKMNPDMGIVDFIQDADLNRGLKYYCERLVEEYDEEIVKLYGTEAEHVDVRLCSDAAGYCDIDEPSAADDYEFEHEDGEEGEGKDEL